MKTAHAITVLISVAVVLWTLTAGYRIWRTPVQYEVVDGSARIDGDAGQRIRLETVPFAEVSGLGIIPLLIPIALALAGAMGLVNRHGATTLLSAVFLLGFAFISGFSIGRAYVAPGLVLLAAGTVSMAMSVTGRARGVTQH